MSRARTQVPPPAGGAENGATTLVLKRFLRHPPERVWTALTDPDELARWHLTTGRIEGRVGGAVELTTGPSRVRGTGRVLAWEPPRLFEYEWSVPATGGLGGAEHATVRWELVAQDEGTLLVLTQRGLTSRTAATFEPGMEAFLDRLTAQLQGDPLPDWMGRVRAHRGTAFSWA